MSCLGASKKCDLAETEVSIGLSEESYKKSFGSIWATWEAGEMYKMPQCDYK